MDFSKVSKFANQAKDIAGKTKDLAVSKGGEINENPQAVADKINGTLDKLDSTLGIDSRSMLKESIDNKMNSSFVGKVGLAAMNNSDKLGKTGEYLDAVNSILNNTKAEETNKQIENKEEKN